MEDVVDRFFDQSEEAPEAQRGLHADPPGIDSLIDRLKQKYRGRITGELVMPAKVGSFADLPPDLDARLGSALRARGIERLYSHQRQAWDAVRSGRHTVVVTPTASGKTLCYNLPVLQAALASQGEGALPLPDEGTGPGPGRGDPRAQRGRQPRRARLHVRRRHARRCARSRCAPRATSSSRNPDMLHVGILPHHTKWAQFFENLQYVVIDEMHTYRGVFGSHLANVLRRLRRVCAFYGASPTFVLCSATIANPQELARAADR